MTYVDFNDHNINALKFMSEEGGGERGLQIKSPGGAVAHSIEMICQRYCMILRMVSAFY